MFEMMETKYNYNIDNLFEEGNIIGDLLKTRGYFAANPPTYEIKGKRFGAAMNNRTFVWMRNPEVHEPTYYIGKDGLLHFDTPILQEELDQKKENSKYILHTGTIVVGYWYADPIVEESAKYFNESKNRTPEKDIIYGLVESNIVKGPVNALLNVLRRYFPKEDVELRGNDIEIKSKKLCGLVILRNFSGVHIQTGVNFDYEKDFFERNLTDDELHRKNGRGITGLKQEGFKPSAQEFMAEWKEEIQSMIDEAEVACGKL
jgi:hypothetical protein